MKRSLMTLQRTPNGGFVLEPGYYELAAQSYSLKTGRPVSSPGGAGYLFAPPKGPREDAVMTVLRNAVNRPEIPQWQIQELLNAILSASRYDEFPLSVKTTAAKLIAAKKVNETVRLTMILPGPFRRAEVDLRVR